MSNLGITDLVSCVQTGLNMRNANYQSSRQNMEHTESDDVEDI